MCSMSSGRVADSRKRESVPAYRGKGDTLVAERIYCVFEGAKGPRRVSTEGRHNAQAMTIRGNPAWAVILRPLRLREPT